MPRISFVVFILLAAYVCVWGETEPLVKQMGKGDISKSPSGRASCFVNYSTKDWNELLVKFSNAKPKIIWKSVRSLGVSWSPSGQYLVVEDYLDRLASAVLVFKIDYDAQKVELIYQTPYSNSTFEHYYAKAWLKDGSELSIKRVGDDTQKMTSEEVVRLNDKKAITQTIYENQGTLKQKEKGSK